MTPDRWPQEYVEHYDLLVHGEQPESEDREHEFLAQVITPALRVPAPRVLAAGCAVGWHAFGLLSAGLPVELQEDREPLRAELLRRLHERGLRVRVHEGGLADIGEDRSFDAVLLLSSCLVRDAQTTREIEERLRKARELLRPGGVLVIDNLNLLAQGDLYETSRRYQRPIDGGRLWVTERLEMNTLQGLVTHQIDGVAERARGKRFFAVRDLQKLMTVDELSRSLDECGFDVQDVTTDYTGPPAEDPNGEQLQFIARRRQD